MTVNRSTYRKAFASLLRTRLSGVAQAVYEYQAGDFNGMSPIVVVTDTGTQRGDPAVGELSSFGLEVHTFVLYSVKPFVAGSDPVAGPDVDILFADTSMFTVGQEVYIEDDAGSEKATITVVTADTSITVDELVNSYTAPRVSIWTEEMSEDALDTLEYAISDEVRLANDDDEVGLSIKSDGRSEIDVVEVGGAAYRHETMLFTLLAPDF